MGRNEKPKKEVVAKHVGHRRHKVRNPYQRQVRSVCENAGACQTECVHRTWHICESLTTCQRGTYREECQQVGPGRCYPMRRA